jgi:outer membrane receptor for ferric coprogen and ferric-rhodotorulic acid
MSLPVRSFVHGILSVCAVLPIAVFAADEPAAETPEVRIIGVRDNRASTGATGLMLDLKDTPQSISVVTSEMMDSYGANDLNDALRLATGINVEAWETNRTNYEARGFEIKNTQIDGVGLPNNWGIVTGAMDSFGYEKLEVVRGANGLLTGVGNASGTINFVRKRPTNNEQGSVSFEGGSWDTKRVAADYSTPFTDDGRWAGRTVVAYEDGDSYLRGLSNKRLYTYGVVDGQLGERTTVAIGYSHQSTRTEGNLWGALTLVNSDGTQAEFGRSASTTQDWTFWDTTDQNAFAELTVALSDRWSLKGTYNYRAHTENDKLFFAYSSTGLDPVTHEGLRGWPGKFNGNDHAHLFDVSVSGKFDAFGREHEALLGVSQGDSMSVLYTNEVSSTDPGFGPLPAFPYAGNAIPEPAWGAKSISDETDQRLRRAYGATRLSLTDRIKVIAGFNYAEYHRDGESSATPFDQTESKVSPYAGVTVDLTRNVLAYASYSDLYQPQDYYDVNNRYLDASKGKNYEIGAKADWLDERWLTTLALFKAEQTGLGIFAGFDPSNGRSYYVGENFTSKGVELEITGRVGENTKVVFGATKLTLKDDTGADTYEWAPRQTLNFSVDTRLPIEPAITVGLGGAWRSKTSTVDSYTGFTVRQDAYAVLNAFARWDATEHMQVKVNLNNLSDEKYITSLYSVGYYGPPRNVQASFRYAF